MFASPQSQPIGNQSTEFGTFQTHQTFQSNNVGETSINPSPEIQFDPNSQNMDNQSKQHSSDILNRSTQRVINQNTYIDSKSSARCQFCGAPKLDSDAKFCSSCGRKS